MTKNEAPYSFPPGTDEEAQHWFHCDENHIYREGFADCYNMLTAWHPISELKPETLERDEDCPQASKSFLVKVPIQGKEAILLGFYDYPSQTVDVILPTELSSLLGDITEYRMIPE